MTTIYLIRHSVRMKENIINEYNTNQDKTIRKEKIILSVEGEKRAEILCNKEELNNIDVVYTSNCVRTLQTAKYLIEKQKLKVNIDERLDERRIGIPNDYEVSNWFIEQFYNENYKTKGGESQKEVRNRFNEVFEEIIKKHKNKRIAIFSHGNAIMFFLLKFCELVNITNDETITLKFKNKIIFDKKINAPEVFKITIENENIEDIELIEFNDLKYDKGL